MNLQVHLVWQITRREKFPVSRGRLLYLLVLIACLVISFRSEIFFFFLKFMSHVPLGRTRTYSNADNALCGR